jgi:hypothetical protein
MSADLVRLIVERATPDGLIYKLHARLLPKMRVSIEVECFDPSSIWTCGNSRPQSLCSVPMKFLRPPTFHFREAQILAVPPRHLIASFGQYFQVVDIRLPQAPRTVRLPDVTRLTAFAANEHFLWVGGDADKILGPLFAVNLQTGGEWSRLSGGVPNGVHSYSLTALPAMISEALVAWASATLPNTKVTEGENGTYHQLSCNAPRPAAILIGGRASCSSAPLLDGASRDCHLMLWSWCKRNPEMQHIWKPTWVSLPPLTHGRSGHRAFLLGHYLVVLGGVPYTFGAPTPGGVNNDVKSAMDISNGSHLVGNDKANFRSRMVGNDDDFHRHDGDVSNDAPYTLRDSKTTITDAHPGTELAAAPHATNQIAGSHVNEVAFNMGAPPPLEALDLRSLRGLDMESSNLVSCDDAKWSIPGGDSINFGHGHIQLLVHDSCTAMFRTTSQHDGTWRYFWLHLDDTHNLAIRALRTPEIPFQCFPESPDSHWNPSPHWTYLPFCDS